MRTQINGCTYELHHGDCLELLKGEGFPSQSFDAVVTDIPYGEVNRESNGLRDLDKQAADIADFDVGELTRLLCDKTKGSIYMFCGTEQVSEIRRAMVGCGMSTRLIVWEKTNPSPMNGEYIWLSGIEVCVFGKRKGATFNAHCRNTVLRHPSGERDLHPTQKPLLLMQELIEVSTNRGDTVLDPFMGSGTTGVACANLYRNFVGIEKNDSFYALCEKRLRDETEGRLL